MCSGGGGPWSDFSSKLRADRQPIHIWLTDKYLDNTGLLKASAHLSPEARSWWHKITNAWELDVAALLLLESALESFDRMRQAQKILNNS